MVSVFINTIYSKIFEYNRYWVYDALKIILFEHYNSISYVKAIISDKY